MRAFAGLLVATLLVSSVGLAASAAFPKKQANIGDSMSQAFAADGTLGDHPTLSWVQGSDPRVGSVFTRQQAAFGTFAGEPESVSGAELVGGDDNFPAQADRVCGQSLVPDEVFVLLGGNDICNRARSSNADVGANLYSPDTSRAFVRAGMDKLMACMPGGGIVQVMSMPRVDYLYSAGTAKSLWCNWAVWPVAGICRIITAETNATKRAALGARIDAYNEMLAEEVSAYNANTNGKNDKAIRVVTDWVGSVSSGFENTSIGTFKFTKDDIDGFDCFHPDVSSQGRMACVAWTVNPNGAGSRAACFAR